MQLPIRVNEATQSAEPLFAREHDLNFVKTWRQSLGRDQNPLRIEAVDLAEVAVHRFEAHHKIQPYARSIQDISDHVTQNPVCEVACLVILKCNWFPDSEIIGIAHFRRTWKNRIILDYLSTHPFVVRPPTGHTPKVRGVGSALLYFLSTIARDYECDAIWGEATVHSHGFYENVLKLPSVEDLIYAPRDNFLRFIGLMDAAWKEVDSPAICRSEDIYAAEERHPPFLGSKTAVFSPARRLAYRFLALPSHAQQELAQSLSLVEAGDSNKPIDEQFTLLFQRATERNKLGDLWQLVESRYPDGEPHNNPFKSHQ